MLGSTLFRAFSQNPDLVTYGSIRNPSSKRFFDYTLHDYLISFSHLSSTSSLSTTFSISKPDIVVNCIGIIKQLATPSNPLDFLEVNACFPHRLAKHCAAFGSKLIHISTDCVFSGNRGLYKESDVPDALDLYGQTKHLGEVSNPNSLTLRTSIIGHELSSARSLVDWFLSQPDHVYGYTKAIFSGLPAIEIARVLTQYVFPYPNLSGLYHLSVDPITKYDLLTLVSRTYRHAITITPDDSYALDRSLNSDLFRSLTGFKPRPWPDLIHDMYTHKSA